MLRALPYAVIWSVTIDNILRTRNSNIPLISAWIKPCDAENLMNRKWDKRLKGCKGSKVVGCKFPNGSRFTGRRINKKQLVHHSERVRNFFDTVININSYSIHPYGYIVFGIGSHILNFIIEIFCRTKRQCHIFKNHVSNMHFCVIGVSLDTSSYMDF